MQPTHLPIIEIHQWDGEAFASAYFNSWIEVNGQELRRIELVATLHKLDDGKVRVERLNNANSNGKNIFNSIHSAASRIAKEAGIVEVRIKPSAQWHRQ